MENFVFDDGGRKAAGFKGNTGDCVVRAIAITSGLPYKEVYKELTERNRQFVSKYKDQQRKGKPTKNAKIAEKLVNRGYTVRGGVYKEVYEPYLKQLGYNWHPAMSIGTGCKIHLHREELPTSGRLILCVSRHLTAYVNGTLHDTYDCSREGNRCVYGWYAI